jgi:glycosyltransferase involved in cell wall biosynthesis
MNSQNSVIIATVLMAVYNDENFVAQCIESILPQLTENIELLIVDDSSSDGSKEILESFSKTNAPIRIIRAC